MTMRIYKVTLEDQSFLLEKRDSDLITTDSESSILMKKHLNLMVAKEIEIITEKFNNSYPQDSYIDKLLNQRKETLLNLIRKVTACRSVNDIRNLKEVQIEIQIVQLIKK